MKLHLFKIRLSLMLMCTKICSVFVLMICGIKCEVLTWSCVVLLL